MLTFTAFALSGLRVTHGLRLKPAQLRLLFIGRSDDYEKGVESLATLNFLFWLNSQQITANGNRNTGGNRDFLPDLEFVVVNHRRIASLVGDGEISLPVEMQTQMAAADFRVAVERDVHRL